VRDLLGDFDGATEKPAGARRGKNQQEKGLEYFSDEMIGPSDEVELIGGAVFKMRQADDDRCPMAYLALAASTPAKKGRGKDPHLEFAKGAALGAVKVGSWHASPGNETRSAPFVLKGDSPVIVLRPDGTLSMWKAGEAASFAVGALKASLATAIQGHICSEKSGRKARGETSTKAIYVRSQGNSYMVLNGADPEVAQAAAMLTTLEGYEFNHVVQVPLLVGGELPNGTGQLQWAGVGWVATKRIKLHKNANFPILLKLPDEEQEGEEEEAPDRDGDDAIVNVDDLE